MEALASLPIPEEVAPYVLAAGLIIVRLSLIIFMMPGLGDSSMNTRTRIAVLMALSLALFPMILPSQVEVVQQYDLLQLVAFESFVGFALGFSFRVLIFALMVAGNIIAQAISLSQLFGAGTVGEPNPSVSMILITAGVTLFVSLDFHTRVIGLFYESYQFLPIGDVPRTDTLGEWALSRTAGAFALGVSLALPFVLINFVYNVILGLINQAMPQMMVTFIGVPANVLAGLFILVLAISAILVAWLQQFDLAFTGFW